MQSLLRSERAGIIACGFLRGQNKTIEAVMKMAASFCGEALDTFGSCIGSPRRALSHTEGTHRQHCDTVSLSQHRDVRGASSSP